MSVPAAIEGEAFERGAVLFGLGAAPFGGPLRLGYVHPVFAVLLLPHLLLSSSTSNLI